jgi:putative flippase GtrA
MRFVKFALVGLSNTAIAFVVFKVLVRRPGLPVLAASALAWIVGFANSFVWNRAWTFADRGGLSSHRMLPQFLVSNLVALAVAEAVAASPWGTGAFGV